MSPMISSGFSTTNWTSQQNVDWEEITIHAYGGLELALQTVLATVVLEVISLDTVRALWKHPKGVELYKTAILYNIINHFVLGVPTYMLAALYFCPKEDMPISGGRLIIEVTFVLMVHSVQYYAIHRTFHESKTLYQAFHRFHHRFNTHVPPSSANAVTMGEYVVAYVVPFAVAAFIGQISISALRLAITITSMLNLIVHTPRLEVWSERWIPSFWVSTNDHLNHHRKLDAHYASPTWNIDNILSCWMSMAGETNGRVGGA